MMLRKIDSDGYFIEDVLLDEIPMITSESEEGDLTLIKDPSYIEVPCQEGLYKPKWTGAEWVEGITEEEIINIKNPITEIDKLWTAIEYLLLSDYKV